MPSSRLGHARYVSLAALRHSLRAFLRFSQDAAREAKISPQQHQVLLAIKGYAGPHPAITMGELAGSLQVRHHSAVGLVDRLARRKLVRRQSSTEDRRRVQLRLTARGERLIEKLSAIHLRELKQIGPELRRLLAVAAGG